MNKWGIYDVVNPPHVLPVDEKGFAINGHTVSDQCWCEPDKQERRNPLGDLVTVIVHHDKGRGGCDA